MPESPKVVWWEGDSASGCLCALDQTLLPHEESILRITKVDEAIAAIKRLSVRGAPLIGIVAAYTLVIALQRVGPDASREVVLEVFEQDCKKLAASRPTAVNLFWAIEEMRSCSRESTWQSASGLGEKLLERSRAIREEDAESCNKIGELGSKLIQPGSRIMTICNAGALATGGIGTATAPMYLAHERRIQFQVFAAETRPLLQGSRLTAWELSRAGIDVSVITDNAVAATIREKQIDVIFTGADRVAANGDVANKIGTYAMALAAKDNGVPFYVCAPRSTFDLTIESGTDIPIEERSSDEVTRIGNHLLAPKEVGAYCPAFDVTPAHLIGGIITERGIIERPDQSKVTELIG